MKHEFQYLGKMVSVEHTEDVTSFSFQHVNNTMVIEIIGTSNNKRARQITVFVVKNLKDAEGNILKSERADYLIDNTVEYTLFYNIPTVANQGLGFTEYMHALNGAMARCTELGGTPSGAGLRIFKADGAAKSNEELNGI